MDSISPDDYTALCMLYARYNHSSDHGDPEDYADCFTEDGFLTAGDLRVEGRAALVAYKRDEQAARAGDVRRHWNGSLSFDRISTNEVRGACYLIAYQAPAGETLRIAAAGVYDDVVARQDGQWRFRSRAIVFD